jgi:ABC-type nitrate/sulfonate/bicarbonate transport system permease component
MVAGPTNVAEVNPMQRIPRPIVNAAPGILFALGVAAVVEALARAGLLTSYVVPPSLATFAQGLVVATLAGVAMGLLMGAFPIVYDALRVVVEFLRPVPAVAMIPLAILFLGLGTPMRVAVVAFAASWPLLVNTLYGVRAVDPVALEVARNFGISPARTLWAVTLPASLASISTGLRVAASIALVVTVTTELVAGTSGIGFYVAQMEGANRLASMYAGILATGILGVLINALFFRLDRSVVFWAPQSREVVV